MARGLSLKGSEELPGGDGPCYFGLRSEGAAGWEGCRTRATRSGGLVILRYSEQGIGVAAKRRVVYEASQVTRVERRFAESVKISMTRRMPNSWGQREVGSISAPSAFEARWNAVLVQVRVAAVTLAQKCGQVTTAAFHIHRALA